MDLAFLQFCDCMLILAHESDFLFATVLLSCVVILVGIFLKKILGTVEQAHTLQWSELSIRWMLNNLSLFHRISNVSLQRGLVVKQWTHLTKPLQSASELQRACRGCVELPLVTMDTLTAGDELSR